MDEIRAGSYFRTRRASSLTKATILVPRPNPFRDSLRSSQNFQDTVSFADWCHKREDNRRAIREARKEWVESKDEEKKRRNAAGSKVAAIADVEELIKDLVTSASTQNTNKGGFSVMKPSRKGLEVRLDEKRNDDLKASSLTSKTTSARTSVQNTPPPEPTL